MEAGSSPNVSKLKVPPLPPPVAVIVVIPVPLKTEFAPLLAPVLLLPAEPPDPTVTVYVFPDVSVIAVLP